MLRSRLVCVEESYSPFKWTDVPFPFPTGVAVQETRLTSKRATDGEQEVNEWSCSLSFTCDLARNSVRSFGTSQCLADIQKLVYSRR